MYRKWLGRDRLRYVIVKEKGVKAEEKVKEFVTYSSLKRTVLVISYEVIIIMISFIRCSESMLIKSITVMQDYLSVMKVID